MNMQTTLNSFKKRVWPLVLGMSLLGASAASLAAEVKEIKQTHNGLTLNANLLMVDNKSYGDGVVLLTPGTLTHKDRSTYVQMQENLAAQGLSSLVINLSLGLSDRHGEYDCAVPHTHKHSDALNEIGFWMDWLKQQGANSVTLMGHSRGGNQTAWFADERDSAQISKVVLLAPATGSQQSASEYQEKYGKPLADVLKKANQLAAKGQGDSLMKNTDFIYCKEAQVTPNAFVDYYTVKPQFDTPTLLKTVKKPTLVIMGAEDTVVADLPEKIAPLVASGKVKSVTIEDADHFFLDLASEDAAAAAAEFIKQK
jgi:pimeloyl-ACP methyl ester carboxylesterase